MTTHATIEIKPNQQGSVRFGISNGCRCATWFLHTPSDIAALSSRSETTSSLRLGQWSCSATIRKSMSPTWFDADARLAASN
eukprot:9340574-Pyramimonas_sp.AAC.1